VITRTNIAVLPVAGLKTTEQFKKMSDALGSKIKAAYQCKEFVVLLDEKERKELKKYAKEQEEESSDSDESNRD
jgi:hypothetical protein